MADSNRIIVGVTGGSGAPLALRLLELLAGTPWETHLVVSQSGRAVFEHETGQPLDRLAALATHVHAPDDLFAPIASGSYPTRGMVVLPCSMKTLAGIATGFSDDLLLRAADVCLKERRRLVLVTRESPLSLIQIENMRRVTLAGGVVLPPVLTMYTHPTSVEDLLDQVLGKVLDVLGVDLELRRRWG
jgi:polyprenyl P-hydroxybenzoate/phenylacrylic acid decarboxylase-like protein